MTAADWGSADALRALAAASRSHHRGLCLCQSQTGPKASQQYWNKVILLGSSRHSRPNARCPPAMQPRELGQKPSATSQKNELWKYFCSTAELSFSSFFCRDEDAEIANVLRVVSRSTLHNDLTWALQIQGALSQYLLGELCKPIFPQNYNICL